MASRAKSPMASRLARFTPIASLLALAACSGVLGIEDLHEGPAPGSAGSGGESNANGGDQSDGGELVGPDGGGGTTNKGGSAGKGPGGGSAGKGPGGGSAGNPAIGGGNTVGGAAGEHGLGEAGAAGGPTAPAGGATVTGHVIDFWGHQVPGIPVEVAGTLTSTDNQGQFVVENVPAQYDVSLMVDFVGNTRENYGWVYQGLTRRDPTLQVYAGLAKRSATIDVTLSNEAPSDTRTLTLALGGPDGAFEDAEEDLTNFETPDVFWRGPTTTQETAHALFWQFNATTSLPTSYIGYSSQVVSLSDTAAQTAINLDVKATTIPAGNISGNVTVATDTGRANNVYVHFSSGAKIQIVNDTVAPAAFSYLVPTIANSTVTFAAVEGDSYFGAFGVAHKDGLGAGNSTLALTIPAPAKPLTPADGAAGVATGSAFSFLPGSGATGPYVVLMISEETYDGIFIVTANKQFKLPEVAGSSYGLQTGDHYDWRIETHGNFASVDAMAGPTGFMDEFSGADADVEPNGEPKGPHTADGSYSISFSNRFTAQ
jgi:hypothetical protein